MVREIEEGIHPGYGSASVAHGIRGSGTVKSWGMKYGKTHLLKKVLVSDMNPSKPNEAWMSDVAYVDADEGTLYASVIIDAFYCKIVGSNPHISNFKIKTSHQKISRKSEFIRLLSF